MALRRKRKHNQRTAIKTEPHELVRLLTLSAILKKQAIPYGITCFLYKSAQKIHGILP